jgi:hypothetical protein
VINAVFMTPEAVKWSVARPNYQFAQLECHSHLHVASIGQSDGAMGRLQVIAETDAHVANALGSRAGENRERANKSTRSGHAHGRSLLSPPQI